jgi:hypothetical protein
MSIPRLARAKAQVSPAGPAPMMAILRGVGISTLCFQKSLGVDGGVVMHDAN